ncbi:hypothetical protein FOA52_010575 [Chlamydomonas sp. UWO 241]|nr:hypothetical protein FOA52_010575 [Chlamydomonas sp. UWO 241]
MPRGRTTRHAVDQNRLTGVSRSVSPPTTDRTPHVTMISSPTLFFILIALVACSPVVIELVIELVVPSIELAPHVCLLATELASLVTTALAAAALLISGVCASAAGLACLLATELAFLVVTVFGAGALLISDVCASAAGLAATWASTAHSAAVVVSIPLGLALAFYLAEMDSHEVDPTTERIDNATERGNVATECTGSTTSGILDYLSPVNSPNSSPLSSPRDTPLPDTTSNHSPPPASRCSRSPSPPAVPRDAPSSGTASNHSSKSYLTGSKPAVDAGSAWRTRKPYSVACLSPDEEHEAITANAASEAIKARKERADKSKLSAAAVSWVPSPAHVPSSPAGSAASTVAASAADPAISIVAAPAGPRSEYDKVERMTAAKVQESQSRKAAGAAVPVLQPTLEAMKQTPFQSSVDATHVVAVEVPEEDCNECPCDTYTYFFTFTYDAPAAIVTLKHPCTTNEAKGYFAESAKMQMISVLAAGSHFTDAPSAA